MIRKAFLMSIHLGCEVEYCRRHDELWPELATTLKAHGASSYSIFLHPECGQLFGYVEIEDEALWHEVVNTTICQQLWAYIQQIMPSHPDNSPISTELTSLFYLLSEAIINRWA
ncbi:L-rhamnose mutarotase [Aeromonas veronii]|uniref:L-rhamnose mutarotase n=1 Tax=Aeromonas veronii TaxID=654 RepID=UPI003D1E91F2